MVSTDIKRRGRHRQVQRRRASLRHHFARPVSVLAAVSALTAAVVILAVPSASGPKAPARRDGYHALSTTPDSYIGLYSEGVPGSYARVTAFTTATGVKPRLVLYYSGWLERFQVNFATIAANNGMVPLVQMDPAGVSISAIASGKYDDYLSAYAKAVRAYRHPLVLSFGHEMNGYWYSWGYTHTSPTVFVAAWRHIVTLFRREGVRNVTWLWTVNTIHQRADVPSPGPWWPGPSYVTWVGVDGYYFNSSATFASLFGPTIVAVRALTRAPLLIAETAAAPAAGQEAKIANLFAGIRLYGLLGFVWFDSEHVEDWRLSSRAAIAAFRREAEMYHMSAS